MTNAVIEPRAAELGTIDVLVVDDDDDIREVMSEIIASHGYSVSAARNGREALKALETVRPRLILLDLNMPVMDGAQFRSEQKQSPSLSVIPTVVISAAHALKNRVASLDVADVLEKPLDLTQLMTVVTRYVAQPAT